MAKDDIDCWGPEGSDRCGATFQGDWDADHEAADWGWTLSNGEHPESFYACPNCKDNFNISHQEPSGD